MDTLNGNTFTLGFIPYVLTVGTGAQLIWFKIFLVEMMLKMNKIVKTNIFVFII